MKRFLFVVNSERADAQQLAWAIIDRLRALGHVGKISTDLVADDGVDLWSLPHIDDELPDVIISLGGDGTMLRALDMAGDSGVAVLGVNLGHLGYLPEIEPDGIDEGIDRVLRGDYSIEERMMLQVTHTTAKRRYLAVNEVVIDRNEGNTIRVEVTIGSEAFLTYAADAIIVATPTGSTAYNLSARGPILAPSLDAMIVTPVSPHMLFDRAVVVDPAVDNVLALTLVSDSRASLVIDGKRVGALAPNDIVTCERAAVRARIIKFGGRSYRDVLVAKFGIKGR